MSRTTSKTLRQRVESFDAGRVPSTLGGARRDPLQCARWDSLQEGGGVADFSEAHCDAIKATELLLNMSGDDIFRHHDMSREIIPKPFIIRWRRHANINQLDNLAESIDDLRNVDGNRIICFWKLEIPHPEQTSTPGLFVGGWQIDQNASHIETRKGLARSVVVYVQKCSKES